MTAEANYGGKVTDKMDRTAITTIIKDFFSKAFISSDQTQFIRGIYEIPTNLSTPDQWKAHVANLDEDLEMPELFGIHKNGNITSQKLMTMQFIGDGIQTIPRGGGGAGGSQDKVLEDKCLELLNSQPILDEKGTI
jgi:hypothetical protein